MLTRVSSIAVFTLFATVATAFAHEHKVMGTVTMAGSDHVMMKTTAGKDVTVNVTAKTKITRGKETVKIDAIKEGTRVIVTTASDEPPYAAIAIQVGAAPKPTPTRKKGQASTKT